MSRLGRVSLFAFAGVALVALVGGLITGIVTTPNTPQVKAAATVRVYPMPGTPTASPRTNITFRGSNDLEPSDVRVFGAASGHHNGTLTQHKDDHGFTFVPDKPFKAGENVRVRTNLPVRGSRDGDFFFGVARPYAPEDDSGQAAGGGSSGGEENSAQDKRQDFASRPDLHPPKLDVTNPAGKAVADGYVFAAPYTLNHSGQRGPMIVNNRGKVVWFHPLDGEKQATNFHVQRYDGQRVLTWWQGRTVFGHGYGSYILMNHKYQKIAKVSPVGYRGADLHEFMVTPRGTALFIVYNPVWKRVTTKDGSERRPVIDCVIQEVDIATGQLEYEWHSLGHIKSSESYGDAISDPGNVYDYLHMNSVSLTKDGNLLVSGRHTHAVYKIDYESGDIIWRLGGKESDFTLEPGSTFYYQHDVRQRANGSLTIFDNGGVYPPQARTNPPHDKSRALVLSLDTDTMTASAKDEYRSPADSLSFAMGNAQKLPNGDIFVGWGTTPAFTEYDKDGDILFNMRMLPDKIMSYRAFRSPWTGRPTEPPAVAADPAGNGQTAVSMSWNGSTQVRRWQVLAGPGRHALHPVTTTPKRGFETTVTIPKDAKYVAVRARGKHGQALDRSKAVKVANGGG